MSVFEHLALEAHKQQDAEWKKQVSDLLTKMAAGIEALEDRVKLLEMANARAAAKNERQAFAEALAQKLTVTYETGGNERPDAWDRLREATIAAKAAWCHCSCDSCVSRGEHHPADCPAPECPWTGPTDMVG